MEPTPSSEKSGWCVQPSSGCLEEQRTVRLVVRKPEDLFVFLSGWRWLGAPMRRLHAWVWVFRYCVCLCDGETWLDVCACASTYVWLLNESIFPMSECVFCVRWQNDLRNWLYSNYIWDILERCKVTRGEGLHGDRWATVSVTYGHCTSCTRLCHLRVLVE